MREALVDFRDAVLQKLSLKFRCILVGHDLVIITVDDQRRHGDGLEVVGLLGLRAGLDTIIMRNGRPEGGGARISAWTADRIDPADRERFVEITEAGLTDLHEGNFARCQVRLTEFAAWRKVWEAR